MIGHMFARRVDIAALVQLRAERGLTMRDLARRSGVSYSLIKYVHAGERQFSDVTAHRIAAALTTANPAGARPVTVEDFSVPKTAGRAAA